MERRVVITSISAITPLGRTEDEIFTALLNQQSGIKPITIVDDVEPYIRTKVFGSIEYPIEYDFKRSQKKSLGPVGFYAAQVAKEIFESSGLEQEFISSGKLGVAFGSTHGSPLVERNMFKEFYSKDFNPYKINPAHYLQTLTHTTAANIASIFNITGRILSSCTACTTSSQSIGLGYEAIKYGIQDVMLCGAADEYDLMLTMVFDKLLAASVDFNDTPELTPRPFDIRRDGLVIGEGAGAILLEDLEFAKKRGANIIGEIAGFSSSCNGGNLVNPDVNGIKQTINMGLDNAKLNIDDIDLISAHATATRVGDIVEAESIYEIYKDKPYVTALKSYFGHLMSTCGVVELICVLYMMKRKQIIPTLNLDEVDPKCSMINHTPEILEKEINIASIQNFAFGGVNTSLFIKKYKD